MRKIWGRILSVIVVGTLLLQAVPAYAAGGAEGFASAAATANGETAPPSAPEEGLEPVPEADSGPGPEADPEPELEAEAPPAGAESGPEAEQPEPAAEAVGEDVPEEAAAPAGEAATSSGTKTIIIESADQLLGLDSHTESELILQVPASLALTATLVIPADKTVSLRGTASGVVLSRGASFSGHMVQVAAGGQLTLGNIILDGAMAESSMVSGTILHNSGNVTVSAENGTETTEFRNNYTRFEQGSAIYNAGTFTLGSGAVRLLIRGNRGFFASAGGIHNAAGATCTLSPSSPDAEVIISGNTSSREAGGVYNAGTFIFGGGAGKVSISGNDSSYGAGGVHNAAGATFTMTQASSSAAATISGNNTSYSTGGVLNEGTFLLNGGAITGNTVSWSHQVGGFTNSGTLTVNGGTIAGNYCYDTQNPDSTQLSNSAEATLNLTGTVTVGQPGGRGLLLGGGNPITLSGNLAGSVIALESADSLADGAVIATRTGGITQADIAAFSATLTGRAFRTHPTDSSKLIVGLIWTISNAVQQAIENATFDAEAPVDVAIPAGGLALAQPLFIQSQIVGAPRHIRLTGGPLTRAAGFTGEMIRVSAGSTLVLENTTLNGAKGHTDDVIAGPLVHNAGTFTMKNGTTLTGNATTTGSHAAAVVSTGTFNLTGGEILNNTNTFGEYQSWPMGGAVYNSGTMAMSGGTIRGNSLTLPFTSSDSGGGGINTGGNLTISGGTIAGNRIDTNYSRSNGGGIYHYGGSLTISGGTIGGATAADANAATYCGGGVYSNGFTFTGGSIVGNTAATTAVADVYTYGVITASGTPAAHGLYAGALSVTGAPVFGSAPTGVLQTTRISIGEAGLDAGASLYLDTTAVGEVGTEVVYKTSGEITEAEKAAFSFSSADYVLDYSPTSMQSLTLQCTIPIAGLQGEVNAATGTAQDPTVINIPANTMLTEPLAIRNSNTGAARHVVFTGGPLLRGSTVAGTLITVPAGSSLTLQDITLNNTFTGEGGISGIAIRNSGTLTMASGARLTGGNVNFNDSGVVTNLAAFNMTGGEISSTTLNSGNYGNSAVYCGGGTFSMSGGAITGNSGGQVGSGVYVDRGATFSMSGGAVTGNTALRGNDIYNLSIIRLSGAAVIGLADTGGLYNYSTVYLDGSLTAGAFVRLQADEEDAAGRVMVTCADGGEITKAEFECFSYTHETLRLARNLAEPSQLVLQAPPAEASLQARIDAATADETIALDDDTALNAPLIIGHSASGAARNVTLRGGSLTRAEGYSGDMLVVPAGSTLTLDGVTVDGAETGGWMVKNSGAFTATGGSILAGNTASSAGTIYNGAGATASLQAGTVLSGNKGDEAGGVDNYGHLLVLGAVISGNTSSYGATQVVQRPGATLTVGGAAKVGDEDGGIALPEQNMIPMTIQGTLAEDAALFIENWPGAGERVVLARKASGSGDVTENDLAAFHYSTGDDYKLMADPADASQIILGTVTLQDKIDAAVAGTPENPVVIMVPNEALEETLVIAHSVTGEARHVLLERGGYYGNGTLSRADGFTGDLVRVPAGSSLAFRYLLLEGGYEMTEEESISSEFRGSPTATGVLLRNYGTVIQGNSATLQGNYTTSALGGAVYNAGSYHLQDYGYIQCNIALDGLGGAVYNAPGGTFTCVSGRIEYNFARSGGGIYNAAGTAQAPGLVCNANSNISVQYNSATLDGGNLYNAGAAVLSGSFGDGRAGRDGGTVFTHRQAALQIKGSFWAYSESDGSFCLDGTAELELYNDDGLNIELYLEPVANAAEGRVVARTHNGEAVVRPDNIRLYYQSSGYAIGTDEQQPGLYFLTAGANIQDLVDAAEGGTAERPVDIPLPPYSYLDDTLVIAHSTSGEARHVRLTWADENNVWWSIGRARSFTGDMVRVPAGSSLVLHSGEINGTAARSTDTVSGVALRNLGDTRLSDVSVWGNRTTSTEGGAIHNAGSLVMEDYTWVGDNSSPGKGGGIYSTGTFTMTDSSTGNNSAASGSEIYLAAGTTLQVAGSTQIGDRGSGGVYLGGSRTARAQIEVTAELNSQARITLEGLEAPANGTVIVTGHVPLTEADAARFLFYSTHWQLLLTEDGKLVLDELGALDLQALIDAVQSSDWEHPVVFEVPDGYELSSTLTVTRTSNYHQRYIKLVGGSLVRAPGFTGTMVSTDSYASLFLEDVTIDGNPGAPADEVDGPLVHNLGVLTLLDGAILRDNITHGAYGGVVNERSLYMQGGQITGNGFADGTEDSFGGGVANGGHFEMSGGAITGNSATYGGGVSNTGNGTFTLRGGVITGNSAVNGGGLYNLDASFYLTDGTIGGEGAAKNTASGDGGGVYNRITGGNNRSATEINGGIIQGNTARRGGGLYFGTLADGQSYAAGMRLGGGTITGNTAQQGGGIHVEGYTNTDTNHTATATLTLSGATLRGNIATAEGGGVYVAPDGAVLHLDGAVSANTAVSAGGGVANRSTGTGQRPGYTLNGGAVTGNTITGAGGTGGGIDNTGALTVTGGIVGGDTIAEGNNAEYGGGIANSGQLNATGGTITGNQADAHGADIYQGATGNISLSRAPVIGNDTGGLYLAGSTVTVPRAFEGGALVSLEPQPGEQTGTVVAQGSGYDLTDQDALAFRHTGHFSVEANTNANTLVLTQLSYRIGYNANGGTGAPADETRYVPGATATVQTQQPTRTGHTFTGWNTQTDGSGSAYTPGHTFTILHNILLYAQWQANSYPITYDELAVAGSQNNPDSYTYGAGFTLAAPSVNRSGFLFDGWVDAVSGEPVTRITNTQTGAVALKATWRDDNSSIPVTGLSLSATELSLIIGDEPVRLVATATPTDATNQAVLWNSSVPEVASVDPAGWVTAVSPGETVVTATSVDGGHTAECTVLVGDGFTGLRFEHNGIPITDHVVFLDDGAVHLSTQRVLSVPGFTPTGDSWRSSNTKVATVDADGLLTLKTTGSTVVRTTVSGDGASYTALLSVKVLPRRESATVQKVTLNKQAAEGLKTGKTLQLKATVTPSTAPLRQVVWAIEDNQPQAGLAAGTEVATVSQTGKVTLLNPGSATAVVMVTDFAADTVHTARCTLQVARPVTGVSLVLEGGAKELRIPVGGQYLLNAQVAPQDATNTLVRWKSSNSKVAGVVSGAVTATDKPGKATISATTADGKKTAKVSVVVYRPASALSFKDPPTGLLRGKTAKLVPVWAAGTPSNAKLNWTTSDPYVATVDTAGQVKALLPGAVEVTATSAEDPAFSATARITVTAPATSVKIDQKAFTIGTGSATNPSTTALSATINGGVPVTEGYAGLKWSLSAEGVVSFQNDPTATETVTASPVLVANPALTGKKTVTVTAETIPAGSEAVKTATVKVTVVPGEAKALESLSVTNTSKQPSEASPLKVGGSYKPALKVNPGSAANKSINWSISPAGFAALNGATGEVKGLRPSGDTVVTVTGTPADARCTDVIRYSFKIAQLATKVELPKSVTIRADGEALVLQANVLPATVSGTAVTWSHSDKKGVIAASTTESGAYAITGLKAGTVTVTATAADGSKKNASCKITVVQQVDSVAIAPPTGKDGAPRTTVDKGKTLALKAVFNGGQSRPKNQKVRWESLDPAIASVSAKGVVKGLSNGTATIRLTALDGGRTGLFTVTVRVPATGVKMDQKKFALGVGRTVTVSATTAPLRYLLSDGEQALRWTSSNETVLGCTALSGENSGAAELAGLSPGSAKVTVTTQSGKTATLTVTVSATAKPVDGIELNKGATWVATKKSETLKPTLLPADAGNKNLIWAIESVTNAGGEALPAERAGEVLTLSATGKVTAKAPGVAVVTVRTVDGGYSARCVVYCISKG